MEKSKFKVGDKVTIINYGAILWIHKDELELMEKKFGKMNLHIISEVANTIYYDVMPEIIGQSGIIVQAQCTQNKWSYAIDGPNKHAWYNNDQLELKV